MSGFFNSSSPTNAPPVYSGLNVGTSQYNMPVPIFRGQRRLSTNAIWFNSFQKKSESGKGKGGGSKGSTAYDYSAAVALGLCEGPIDSIANVWANGSTTTTTSLSALNMTLFPGTAGQTPWSFVTTNYPDQARAYAYTAYLVQPKIDLGESATIPDNAFECVAAGGYAFVHTTAGWINPATHVQDSAIDILLSDFVPELLTSPQFGMGFASNDIGSLTQWESYQKAQGLFFSPLLNSQEKCTDIIDRYAQLTNSWIYWSGLALQFVPLGDVALSGNDAIYTPAQDVLYNLTTADFIRSGDDDPPVKVNRKDPADCYNRTQIDITDRTLGYIDNPFEYKDQTLVDQYGLRDNESVQADEICDPEVGKIVVQLVGKRAAYIRKTYSFKTSHRYKLCLPGTVLTLTEPSTGLTLERVRVTKISRDAKRKFSFTCEEFPGTVGTYTAPGASVLAIPPSVPNEYVLPGGVNTPAVLEPDSVFTGGVPKIIIAASGGANWGGCDVYLGFDGESYSKVGSITSAARQGVLTADLAALSGANPDTGHTLAVDFSETLSALTTVTEADADALRTLSLVSPQPTVTGDVARIPTTGELLAFGDVTATGTYAANLTYLVRGQYGTAPGAHSIGEQFTAIDILGIDGTAVAYALPAEYIGKTLYLKLASFNLFRQSVQDLSTCIEYQYIPSGAGYGGGVDGVPSTPTGLTVDPSSALFLALNWSRNPAADTVLVYTLYVAAGLDQPFSAAALIFRGDSVSVAFPLPTPDWTFFLTATNTVGESTPSTGVNSPAATSAAIGAIVTSIETISETIAALDETVTADAETAEEAAAANAADIVAAEAQASDLLAQSRVAAAAALKAALTAFQDDIFTTTNTFRDGKSVGTLLDEEVVNRSDAVSAVLEMLTTMTAQIGGLQTDFTNYVALNDDAVAGKASISDLTALSDTVTTQGDTLSALGGTVSTLSTDFTNYVTANDDAVAGKASITSLNTLSDTVTTQGGTLGSLGTSFTDYVALNDDAVAGKADASALTTLSDTVTTQGDTLSALGGTVSTLSTNFTDYVAANDDAVAGKASITSLNTLSDTVTTQGGTLGTLSTSFTDYVALNDDAVAGKAAASDLSALSTTVGDHTASISTLETTTADSAAKLSVARFELIESTDGSSPAIFGIVSDSVTGSAFLLQGDRIYFGTGTLFDNATATLRTSYASGQRIIALGAPFGVHADLIQWQGLVSVSYADMDTSNADFFQLDSGYTSGDKLIIGSTVAASTASTDATASCETAAFNGTGTAPKVTVTMTETGGDGFVTTGGPFGGDGSGVTPTDNSGSSTATITVYESLDNKATWTSMGTVSCTGIWTNVTGTEPADFFGGPGYVTVGDTEESLGGADTFTSASTDPTLLRAYKATMTARSIEFSPPATQEINIVVTQ